MNERSTVKNPARYGGLNVDQGSASDASPPSVHWTDGLRMTG